MNEMHHTAAKSVPGGEHMSFVEMLIALAKHKKKIVGSALTAAVLSAGISMVLPETYKASVKLLPPQQAQSSASMILSQLGGLAGAAAGAAGLKNPADVYIGMLKSRTIADRLASRFALEKHYGVQSREKTLDRLEKNTTIVAGKDGLISIQVEDRDQKQVAVLANAYVEELMHLTKTLAVTEAGQRRMFFEQELERAKNNLAKSEMAVKGAIEQRGVVSVDTESRAQLEIIARLRAQVSAKEVERDAMKAFVTPNHPEYQRAEEAVASLRAELSRLENGRPSTGGDTQVNGQGLKNIQLLRDVKYYQMLYELLAKQYEAARLDEAKDASVIQVLDPAVMPERRFAPKRALIVIVATVLTGLLAIAAVLLGEAKRRWLRSPASAGLWSELKSSLRFK